MNRLMDETQKWVKDFMKAGEKGLADLQDSPIGKEPRTKKEYAMMLAKLKALSPEERQIRMQELANLAGHQGDQLDDCELCTWLKEAMRKQVPYAW